MKPNKININRPKISSEEIAAHKNFEALLKKVNPAFKHKPMYRQVWFAPALLAAAAAIIIAIYVFIPAKNNNNALAGRGGGFITNPIKGVDVAYSVYTVDADSGKDIICASGSKIKIPANAFTDGQGQVLRGKVRVKYREFRDAVDIFVSGIPMSYDSGGTKYQFESAGMCEILADQNDKPVNPNPASPITIQYKSNYGGTQYNLYELDTTARNWKCIGKDKVEPIAQQQPVKDSSYATGRADTPSAPPRLSEKIIKNIKNEIAKLEKTKPEKPIAADKVKRHFQFKVNPKQFPELSTYSNVMFTIVGVEDKDVPKAVFTTVWKNVKLEENVKGVNYKMTVSKGATSYSYIVCPVFEGTDYDNAMKLYDDKYTEYKTALAKKQAEENRLAEERNVYEENRAASERITKIDIDSINNSIHSDDVVFRSFIAKKFDVIYNCDRLAHMSGFLTLRAGFEDNKGNVFHPLQVYMANTRLNGLTTFYDPKISYEPTAKNVMWGITSDNKLAYFTSEDFKTVPKTDSYTFKMRIYEGELKSEDDVRKVLGI